jgi:hypothetical protein
MQLVGKTAIGTCKILENVYGNKVLSQLHIFELSEIFQQGCYDLGNSLRSGRQSTARNPGQLQKFMNVSQRLPSGHKLDERSTAHYARNNFSVLHEDLGN